MTETSNPPADLMLDPDAAALYITTAAHTADMLTTAADHADAAATASLAGLGLLGREFATTWATAVGSQAATVRIAAALLGAYSVAVSDHTAAVSDVDTDIAAALIAAAQEV
ncbi:hypothetical protein [Actinoplanes sp. GCM10030250]|uniref:hypothetical protein n=1 Tax=Actinoplanes sp. GCM10030250 TaxID=3273376 RepID=UPI00361152C2